MENYPELSASTGFSDAVMAEEPEIHGGAHPSQQVSPPGSVKRETADSDSPETKDAQLDARGMKTGADLPAQTLRHVVNPASPASPAQEAQSGQQDRHVEGRLSEEAATPADRYSAVVWV